MKTLPYIYILFDKDKEKNKTLQKKSVENNLILAHIVGVYWL